jgi:hypothetical protein
VETAVNAFFSDTQGSVKPPAAASNAKVRKQAKYSERLISGCPISGNIRYSDIFLFGY